MNDQQVIWSDLSVFYAAPFTQDFLSHHYSQKLNKADAEKKSFENCYPFIYYLEHSKNYYKLAEQAPLSIQPMLLFYGISQLLKACLLVKDSQYPANTSILAHGVSTRKRKKQDYKFLDDEVKIQKSGLFPHIDQTLFNLGVLEHEKYSMKELLIQIPETHQLFKHLYRREVSHVFGSIHDDRWVFSDLAFDYYKMSERRFHEYFYSHLRPQLIDIDMLAEREINPRLLKKEALLHCAPFSYSLEEDVYCFPFIKPLSRMLPEILVHYLLLYNLSMISRYETEWWYELLYSYSSKDYPFIVKFLEVTKIKSPFLLKNFLLSYTKKADLL
ncbi:YaaC family protein [Priestia filamentosa]|uniref:YaaC family protein n=1 Tax=Priestia filamentosa TaxID=1402861 RepID=UPI000E71F4C5|nr:YaaC family protein [Priestia filamentosa]RJS67547.1 hypothetical protein CJ485_15055 [Priestia filamentosa]